MTDDRSRRVVRAPTQEIARVVTSLTGTATAKIYLPGFPVLVKAALQWVPNTPTTVPNGAPLLWAYLAEEVRVGAPAGIGAQSPVANVAGTSAAPLAIPFDAGLFGHIIEVQSEADMLILRLGLTTATTAGRWLLDVSFREAVEGAMARDEWEAIRSFASSAIQKPLLITG